MKNSFFQGSDLDLYKNTQKIRKDWLGYYRFKEWEHVIRTYKTPNWSVKRTVSWVIKEILVEFNWNDRFFVKRMKISWYDDEVFSPKKFKKFYPPIKIDKNY